VGEELRGLTMTDEDFGRELHGRFGKGGMGVLFLMNELALATLSVFPSHLHSLPRK